MNIAFSFLKSTRSIAVVIVVFALSVALFLGKVSAEQYITVATVIIGSYFAKRDESTQTETTTNDSGETRTTVTSVPENALLPVTPKKSR